MITDLDDILLSIYSTGKALSDWYMEHWILCTSIIVLLVVWRRMHILSRKLESDSRKARENFDHLISRTGGID